ncbi:Ser/Thr protein phosphatase family protein [Reticulomyxa filosa]|uniref:Ser/Thr protein phosphatase family protein n=1 Tax=Reticulomyxa filosa TaxID=46433 RepID=X6MIR6_RETFI|nr:Ser/Thr protein phosphatase family protein [Reticulomyxa filosa]|eukprot:ETO12945.1 Ser/Thr protein phosphatase family protein [Reticulomyxa filosa]
MYCSARIALDICFAIVILIVSVVIIPCYFLLLIPCFLVSYVCNCGCVSTPNDLFKYRVFWLLHLDSYVAMPFYRLKYGYPVLYYNEKLPRKLNQGSKHDCTVLQSIPKGDVLIHCGDITFEGKGGIPMLKSLNDWMASFYHPTKIVMGGNHDRFMPMLGKETIQKRYLKDVIYLENNGIVLKEYNNFTIYGVPWSPTGSQNNAFQDITETTVIAPFREFVQSNQKVDILLSHSSLMDLRRYASKNSDKRQHFTSLWNLFSASKCLLHLCGHFHARHGVQTTDYGVIANCAVLNRLYLPMQYPMVFDFDFQK